MCIYSPICPIWHFFGWCGTRQQPFGMFFFFQPIPTSYNVWVFCVFCDYLTFILLSLTNSRSISLQLTKKKARKTERIVTQLLFSRWPEVGLPLGADFLHFVKSVFACRQSSLVGGKLLLQSRYNSKGRVTISLITNTFFSLCVGKIIIWTWNFLLNILIFS